MESKLGKIVLYNNKSNPVIVISESDTVLRGLEIVQKDEDCVSSDKFTHFKLSSDDFEKIKYRGQKLNDPIVDCCKHNVIRNLDIRTIANISEDTYYKLLKNYVCHYASSGAADPCYLSVRDDVHNQLIKLMNK